VAFDGGPTPSVRSGGVGETNGAAIAADARPAMDRRPRKGVVLAAGRGSRLSSHTKKPKLLQPLLGMPLVERSVRVLLRAGLEEVYVVYGAFPEIAESCSRSFRGIRARVQPVYAPRWQEGNGASLAAVAPFIGEDETFVSIAADHLTDVASIERLMEAQAPAVLVDCGAPDGIDFEEATKVVCQAEYDSRPSNEGIQEVVTPLPTVAGPVSDSSDLEPSGSDAGLSPGSESWPAGLAGSGDCSWQVVDIGKEVTPAPGSRVFLDAGAHLLTGEVFAFLGPAPNGEEVTVSRALRALAATGRLRAVPLPKGAVWQDIDTPEDLAWAKRKLLRSLRSEKDGPVARYLNRPLSLAITRAISRFRPSPNAVSFAAFLTAMLAAVAVALPDFPRIAAAALVQFASVIDGVDGEVARATFRDTRFGAFLDGILDRVGDAAVLAAVGIKVVEGGGSPAVAIALVAGAISAAMLSMASKDKLSLLLKGSEEPSGGAKKSERQASQVPGRTVEEVGRSRETVERIAGNILAGRDGRLFLVALFVAAGWSWLALVAVCVSGAAGLAVRTWGAARILSEKT
jgi:NDP-sugar pyrophosphorylase family protein/phosphatidylglycerophosphate synthase